MKTIVSFLVSLVICVSSVAQNTDLPGPTPNLQTLPDGSYIIPMDNVLQTDNVIGSGNFNLAAYGLIVHLLNNNIKIKWVIRAGKAKDGIDFTGNAEQLKPTYVAGAVSRNFIAGPFVIFAADTTGVAALIDSYYTSQTLTGNNRPRVFRTSGNVLNVDIRYNLTGFVPKTAILNDGGKQAIHVSYMTACKIPTTNYMVSPGGDLIHRCFTFASEPHNDVTGPVIDSTIKTIRKFVEFGGNFLAQCWAIPNYENNPLGRFQTTNGITVTNAAIGTNLSYPNPDLSFSQFQGSFNGSLKGSCRNWQISGAPVNNAHQHATGTGVDSTNITANVSKLKSGIGGLVFYLGNHDFDLVNDGLVAYNGIRMYMNAMLTPVLLNNWCNIGDSITPLPVKLLYFNAFLYDNNRVDLKWATVSEINTSNFVIERSTDGINFYVTGVVFAYGNETEKTNYSFSDDLSDVQSGVVYYRLRSVDIDGKSQYSETRIIRISKQTENAITIVAFPNPVITEVRISIPNEWQNKKVVYEVLNANGQVSKRTETGSSSQTETVNMSTLARGFYIVRVSCEGQTARQKIVKQ